MDKVTQSQRQSGDSTTPTGKPATDHNIKATFINHAVTVYETGCFDIGFVKHYSFMGHYTVQLNFTLG
jgi:hypothetical protein